MLFSQRFPSLNGGVSQATDTLKGPHEFNEVDNVLIDEIKGLRKRPGTKHTGYLGVWGTPHDKGFYETVNRSDTERYTIHITNGNLKVFDTITASEYSVAFPDGKGYLFYTNNNAWRACTVGDSTFLVNREKTVTRAHESTPWSKTDPQTHGAWLYLGGLDDSPDRPWHVAAVTVNGSEVKPFLWNNNTSGTMANAVYRLLDRDFSTDYYVERYGASLVYLERKDGDRFSLEVSRDVEKVRYSVKSFEELPGFGPEGLKLKVEGQPGSNKDDTWVLSEKVPGGFEDYHNRPLQWTETVAPDTPVMLDEATMPHVLVRSGNYKDPLPVTAGGDAWGAFTGTESYGPEVIYGWDYDAKGELIGGNDYRFITVKDDGAYTVDIPSVPGTTQKITCRWTIDTQEMPIGSTCGVFIDVTDKVTGLSVASLDNYYLAGRPPVADEKSVTFSKVTHPGPYEVKITLYHTGTPWSGGTGLPLLALYGALDDVPPVTIQGATYTRMDLGQAGQWWPMGMVFDFPIGTGHVDYTLAEDMLTEDLALDLADKITDAGMDVTVGAAGRRGSVFLEVSKGGVPVALSDATGYLDPNRYCFFPEANFTPGSLVSLRAWNNTTRSSGTILSNSRKTIEAPLSGGSRTTYLSGDEVAIERNVGTDFIFKKVPWQVRLVGDTESSPWPSFVDQKITDVFYHRGRLGVLTGNSVVMTASQDLYRFFRRTTTSVLDDDPIDVEVAGRDVTQLASAVEWAGMLLLSSNEGANYNLVGEPILSPKTVALENLSSFPQSPFVRPYRLGSSLIFCSRKAGYTNVRDVFESIYGRLTSNTLTDRIPRYIKGDVVDICGDSDKGILCLLTNDAGQNTVYVWSHRKDDTGAAPMAAWSRWTFPRYAKVAAMDMYQGYLYLFTKHSSSGGAVLRHHLERLDIANIPTANATNYSDGDGDIFNVTAYDHTIAIPTLLRRSADGFPQTEGRTQVRYLLVNYEDTQKLTVTVTPSFGVQRTYSVDSLVPLTGTLKVPILQENKQVSIKLSSSDPGSCTISGIEWEAYYHSRNQRV